MLELWKRIFNKSSIYQAIQIPPHKTPNTHVNPIMGSLWDAQFKTEKTRFLSCRHSPQNILAHRYALYHSFALCDFCQRRHRA